MTVDELIQLLKNRLSFLRVQRSAAFERGDADCVTRLDEESLTTQATLDQLLTLVN